MNGLGLTGASSLLRDPELDLVALSLARLIVSTPVASRAALTGAGPQFARDQGIYDQPVVTFTMNATSLGAGLRQTREELSLLLTDPRLNRIGLTREPDPLVDGTDLYVVVAVGRHVQILGDFAGLTPGDEVPLVIESIRAQLAGLSLLLTDPEGRVVDIPLDGGPSMYQGVVGFPLSGDYDLEVTGEGRYGPEVLALTRVNVGGDRGRGASRAPRRERDRVLDRTEVARLLFQKLNEARLEANAPMVRWDDDLAEVASEYAEYMVRFNHLAHIDRDGRGPRERVMAAGGSDYLVGENVARSRTGAGIHQQIMASPAHQRNTVNTDWTHVGIGVALDRSGTLWAAEVFAGRPVVIDDARWTTLAVHLTGTLRTGTHFGVVMDNVLSAWVEAGDDGLFETWVEYPRGRPRTVELVLPEGGAGPAPGETTRYQRVQELRVN